MKKVFKKGIALFLSLLMLTSGIGAFAADTTAAETSTPRVFVIGDSTACSYGSDSERTGWGETLQNFLTDPKMVVNAASPGESSHSFYDKERHWNTVKARLKKGDYLLIQFGHNDCSEGDNTDYSYYSNPELSIEEHNPESGQYSYKWYLKQYIEAANSVGAYPILVTSVERKTHLASSASPLAAYADAMKALATEEVPVIDVWTEFRADAIESWYVSDGVHLAEKGAMEVARIFANGIKASSVASAQSLAGYLVSDIDAVTTHTDILDINEDFEDYTVANGESLYPGKPLSSTFDNDTATTYGRVIAETESNNAVKIVASSSSYNVSWNLPYTLSSGYYKVSYRFKGEQNSTMEFITKIGGYSATTRYSKNSINYSSGDNLAALGVTLKDGNWVNVDYYFDPGAGKMYVVCEDTLISNATSADKAATIAQLQNVSSISIGFAASKSGTLYLDDIQFSEVSEKEYNLVTGTIPVVAPPTGITAMEDFEYAKAGTELGTTHYNWKNVNSVDNSFIKYVQDPANSSNLVAKFERQTRTISKHHNLSYTFSEPLTDGVYSAKFRVYAEDKESDSFWISILDTDSDGSETADKQSRHFIGFRMNTDYVSMYSTNDGVTNTEAAANYDFNLNTWYDLEIVYDLTPETTINASVYINGERVINRARVGGGKNYTNDGTISSVCFQLPADGAATVIADGDTPADGIYASFLLDDIVIKQTSIVTGVTAAEGKVSGVSAYFDKAPSTSPKFVAAVYDGRALKDVAFANAIATAGSQSVTLSKSLSVASGNTVKVYYWDMTKLIPCIKMFETTIE